MELKVGDNITEIETGDELTVKSIWPKGASKYIDFDAEYEFSVGVDQYGNLVKPSRGFSYVDEGTVWRKI